MKTKQLYIFLQAVGETVVLEHEVMTLIKKLRSRSSSAEIQALSDTQTDILQKTKQIQQLYASYFSL